MRKLVAVARRAIKNGRATAAQLTGIGGVTWGAWGLSSNAGKIVGGLLLALFGVALERGAD